MQTPQIGIVYIDHIDKSFFEDFHSEVSHSELSLNIEARPELGQFASVEWFIPTAIVAFIGKPYFEEFLKEMGKEHYGLLKSSLKKLSKKSANHPRLEPVIMGTPGKIQQNNPYTMTISIMAEGRDGYTFKLLLPKDSKTFDYEETVEKFMDFIASYHLSDEASKASQEIARSEILRGIVLVHLNPKTNEIEWLDHIPAEVRARMRAQQDGAADS